MQLLSILLMVKFQNKIEDSSTQMKISDLLRDNYDFDNMDGNKLKFYNSLRRNFTDKDIFYEQFEGDNVKEAIDIFHDINIFYEYKWFNCKRKKKIKTKY